MKTENVNYPNSYKLKQKELSDYRKRLLQAQQHLCPICGTTIQPDDAVLDHDHDTGRVRAVLHRQCNQVEGRVMGWCSRTGKGVPPEQVLQGILAHIRQDYDSNPIHPTHLTPTEREVKRLRKHYKRLKCPRARERTALRIQSLTEDYRGSEDE